MQLGLRRYLIAITIILAGGTSGAAFATPAYNGLYVFGDSLSDTGNVFSLTAGTQPVSPPYSNGHFTNGNVWIQDVVHTIGLGPVTPSLTGGNNFAYGGAETGTTLAHSANPTDLTSQLTQYNRAVTSPQPDALYTLWIGANDINSLLSGVRDTSLSFADINTDVDQTIANVGNVVDGLAASGMTNLLALNVPDLSKTPNAIAAANATADPAATLAQIRTLTSLFDSALGQELATLSQTYGFDLNLVDAFSALDDIVANPDQYGLSNVTDSCWTGNFTDPQSGSVCANPGSYLFWDGLHPTAAGHRLVANAALDSLNVGSDTGSSTTDVPEPGNIAIFLIGLFGIAIVFFGRGRGQRLQPSAR